MTLVLDVFLNDVRIGSLTQLTDKRTLFSFHKEYTEAEHRPTLSQHFLTSEKTLITQLPLHRERIHPFFSNLLPEGVLRDYIAQKSRINVKHEFELLRLLGEDLPGAVVIKSAENYKFENLERRNELGYADSVTTLYRFSLAGIQLKFSALMKPKGGLTIPVKGVGGNWIVKLPSSTHNFVPENEFSMMHLAREVGIDVPDTQLIPLHKIEGLPDLKGFRGSYALAVKRFDRLEENRRVHIEDFAQVYGVFPERKYDQVSYTNMAGMIWSLTNEEGLKEYISRLVFIILTGNGDMHLKNWSFIYHDMQTPRLSPAYDLLSTIPYIYQDKLALKLVNTKEMMACNITLFEQLAEKVNLPKKLVRETVKETVTKTYEAWNLNKNSYDYPAAIKNVIDKHMNQTLTNF